VLFAPFIIIHLVEGAAAKWKMRVRQTTVSRLPQILSANLAMKRQIGHCPHLTRKRTNRLMTTIGYARVSTGDQHTALQLDALRKAGCEKLFEDKASGVKTDRPGLAEAVRYARDGDTLTVWKLDRLGRSMKHLIEIVTELESKGVGFRSITENIDTTTPGGRLVFHLFGALAQFERDLIRERTRAGLQAAEERGRRGGRQAVVTPEKLAKARQHLAAGLNVREAAARVKIGKTALYQALKAEKSAAPTVKTA
jgi:DNA invertase Pin-like site-specific DNA recombinase